MTKVGILSLGAAVFGVCVFGDTIRAQQAAATAKAKPAMAVSHAPEAFTSEAGNKLVGYYCTTCHDDDAKTGGLSLEHFDAARVGDNVQSTQTAEKMIRKLRLGMMPPPSVKDRPDPATVSAFVTSLETRIDAAAALRPNPGRRTFQRLNRAEYARAIRDLLALDVDVNAFLPPDTVSAGYDNIADVQTFSPTLL